MFCSRTSGGESCTVLHHKLQWLEGEKGLQRFLPLWATLLVSALVGLGCMAHAAHFAQKSLTEGELYIDLAKETRELFSSEKYMLCVPGKYQFRPCEQLNLIEEKHSIISAYLN